MKKQSQNEEAKIIYQDPPSELLQSIINLYSQGQLQQALSESNQMLEEFPNSFVLYNISGASNAGLMQFDVAIENYKQALKIKPDYVEAYYNMGVAQKDKGDLEAAIESYKQALKINPDYAEAYNNMGVAQKDKGDPEAAIESYKQALKIKSDYAEAYNNIGNVLKDQGDPEAAIESYKQAINIKPDYVESYWNKSLIKLLIGEYLEGWKLYEWRWKKKPHINTLRLYQQPLWLGDESIFHKTLLIYPEQGLGDYIQFIRYAALVEQLGAKVILEVPSRLLTLCSTLKGQPILIENGKPLPSFDYHCPVMSLPLALKTSVETIPAKIPYLYADDQRKKRWNEKLGNKTVTRIGLVWSGSTWHENDHNRSLLLKQLASLLVLPVEFHSLQKDVREIDIKTLIDFPKINQHQDDLIDFSDTAALIDEMDLVISVDTAVAHLSGAMGKKTFILLPYSPDYRWMLDRADTPWYPTATLFRQPSVGDWDSVISEIIQLLSD